MKVFQAQRPNRKPVNYAAMFAPCKSIRRRDRADRQSHASVWRWEFTPGSSPSHVGDHENEIKPSPQ